MQVKTKFKISLASNKCELNLKTNPLFPGDGIIFSVRIGKPKIGSTVYHMSTIGLS